MSDQLSGPREWKPETLDGPGGSAGNSGQPWRGVPPPEGRHWRTPTQGAYSEWIAANVIPDWPDAYATVHDRLDALDAAGLIHWPKTAGGLPRLKRFLEASRGRAVTDLWDDIHFVSGAERAGYPTQKPVALLERIIKASSNEGDIVFDPFCGSGTTLVAAKRLGRRWLGMDANQRAVELSTRRLARTWFEPALFDEGGGPGSGAGAAGQNPQPASDIPAGINPPLPLD